MIMVRKNELACRDEWAHDLWEERSNVTGPDAAPLVVPFPTGPVKPATDVEIAALIRADSSSTPPPPAHDVVLSEMGGASRSIAAEDRGIADTPTHPTSEWARPENRDVPPRSAPARDVRFASRVPSAEELSDWNVGRVRPGSAAAEDFANAGSAAAHPSPEPFGLSLAMRGEAQPTSPDSRGIPTFDDTAAALAPESEQVETADPDWVTADWMSEPAGNGEFADEFESDPPEPDQAADIQTSDSVVVSNNTEQSASQKRRRGFRLADLFSRGGALDDRDSNERSLSQGTWESRRQPASAAGVRSSDHAASELTINTPRLEPLLGTQAESRTVSRAAADRIPHLEPGGANQQLEQVDDDRSTRPVGTAGSEWSAETLPTAYPHSLADLDDQTAVSGSVSRERLPDRWPLTDQPQTSRSTPPEPPLTQGVMPQPHAGPRRCRSCRDFRPTDGGDRGWCANEWAFSHRRMVESHETAPCAEVYGDWWTPNDAAWFVSSDVSSHGQATPLLDAFVPDHRPADPARRRS